MLMLHLAGKSLFETRTILGIPHSLTYEYVWITAYLTVCRKNTIKVIETNRIYEYSDIQIDLVYELNFASKSH